MKHLIFIITGILLTNLLPAQAVLTVKVAAPDTATSIFSHNICSLVTDIPVTTIDEENETWQRIWISSGHSCYQVRLPGTDWMRMQTELKVSNYLRMEAILPPHTNTIFFINMLPLFAEHPGLFESVQTGAPLLIRYRANVRTEAGPNQDIYSNVDTMYLPPATQEDIDAYGYLKSNITDVRAWSYLGKDEKESLETCQYLIEHYPTTIIAEIAKFQIKDITAKEMILSTPRPTNAALSEYIKQQNLLLRHSKSEMIKYYVRTELGDMGVDVDD